MKNFFSKAFVLMLFMSLCSFTTANQQEQEVSLCTVKITTTNPNTGESTSEYYYSTERTSAEDCANGAEALANGFFMLSSDFKRSPIILDMED